MSKFYDAVVASFTPAQVVAWIKTLVKTFAVVVLGFVVVWGPAVFDKTATDWKVALASGTAAVAAVILGWIDPTDQRYGLGAK